nr:aminoglycoside phosphotransferase family protein [Paenibacillus xylanexedens]
MSTITTGLHRAIPTEILYQLVEKNFGTATKVKRYSLLQGGLFNTTYRVLLEHAAYSDVILRLAPERIDPQAEKASDPLFSFERTMMTAEPVVYDYYQKAGIPAPHVIVCDNSGSIISRTYMFMEFIPSKQLNHPSISLPEKDKLYRELGKYTAAMHQIQGESFGWPQGGGTIQGSDRWSEVLMAFAEETAWKAEQVGYMPGVGEQITSMFRDHSELFDEVTVPVLVHNDLWESNVLIHEDKDDKDALNIAAIIDGDRSMFADREFEAILSTAPPAFHEGYGQALDMSDQGLARRLAYRILSSYFNAYVHEYQVDQPHDGQKFCQRTLDLMEQWKMMIEPYQ